MSPAEELPQELWTQILSSVLPWSRRLSVCALVCQKLRRAAAAATQSVTVWPQASNPERANNFLNWSNSYGRSLTALELGFSRSSSSSIRQLAACGNLVQLKLFDCSVQLCAGSGDAGLLHSCTALTALVLNGVTVLDISLDEPAVGMAAAPVARLQSLALKGCDLPDGREGPQQAAEVCKERLIPHLTSLTCLNLCYSLDSPLHSALMQHLSSLVKLEQLLLDRAVDPLTNTDAPGIGQLTALKDLRLRACDVEPSCLLPMATGLTRLDLEIVALLPLEQQQQQDGQAGGPQLLQLLARLPALQSLRLIDFEGEWPQQLSAFSSLTASSNLQELEVCGCYFADAAWEYVFPAGRKLPSLHTFNTRDSTGRGAVFCSATIAGLAACCPALRALTVAPYDYTNLTPLESLTALSSLVLCPISRTGVPYLPRLTQLKKLELYVALPTGGIEGTVSGLRQLVCLTALTGLEQLTAYRFEEEQESDESDVAEEDIDIREIAEVLVFLYSKAKAGSCELTCGSSSCGTVQRTWRVRQQSLAPYCSS